MANVIDKVAGHVVGPQGPQGPQGPKGDTGQTGPQGATGATGATPNLAIGTVTTLDPDSQATATITGTAENPVLNLGLPKGRTGEVSQAEFDEVAGDVSQLKSELTAISENIELVKSANLLDMATVVDGYVTAAGVVSTSASYKRSDKIAVSEGDVITAWRSVNLSYDTETLAVSMRFICAYDSNGNAVESKGSGVATETYTVPSGITHIIVSISSSYFDYDVSVIKSAIEPNYIANYFEPYYGANPDFLPVNYRAQNGMFSVQSDTLSGDLYVPEINVNKNVIIAFDCNIASNFASLSVGQGVNNTSENAKNYTSFIRVTPTTVTIVVNKVEHTYEHGLTVADYIKVIIKVSDNTKANITVMSGGGTYTRTIGWYGFANDRYIARGVGTITNCKFTVYLKDINANTYAFGDSYMAILESPERWSHWMIDSGYGDNVLINACSGEDSIEAGVALQNIFRVGIPKRLLWSIGMNDGSDADANTPSTQWKQYIDFVVSLCDKYGIELILATIPTVPTINHEAKNAWVRASGYTYIDFAKAVGAQSDGTWYSGMLSNDNVHPTEIGAKALWQRVLVDAPQILG